MIIRAISITLDYIVHVMHMKRDNIIAALGSSDALRPGEIARGR